MKPTTTVETLPRRRGVVIRAAGISDSYGTSYVRCPRTGALRRTSDKVVRRVIDWLAPIGEESDNGLSLE